MEPYKPGRRRDDLRLAGLKPVFLAVPGVMPLAFRHRHAHPASVHDGIWAHVQARRAATLRAAYEAHPEHFRGRCPQPKPLPTKVWVNEPPAKIETTTFRGIWRVASGEENWLPSPLTANRTLESRPECPAVLLEDGG